MRLGAARNPIWKREAFAQEAHEKASDDLTKAEASKEIDRLKNRSGTGSN
jgi:hypothetical protein